MEQRPSRSYGWLYAVVLVLAAAMLGVGIWRAVNVGDWTVAALGALALVVGLAALPIALALDRGRKTQLEILGQIRQTLEDRLEQTSIMLNLISEQQLLSDQAKRVAFREKDRDALRRAIQEEIAKCDWEAASMLVNDIETEFGYRQEAMRFREEIARCRGDHERRMINEAIAVIDRHTRSERWSDAMQEAQRLLAAFPNNETVRSLPADIENRRNQHKQRLLDSWHEAVARRDVDGSIEILKQLDMYLSPGEAESLQETARGVFKEKLNLLRLQFASAVQDHRWGEAVNLGDQIVRDFPNTRIAQEVREKMDALRQRAAEPEEVAKV